MRFKILFLCILLAFFLIAATASARITISPSFSTQIEYTDNVFRTEDDEEEEYITAISAGIALDYLEKTGGLTISYRPEYAIYGRFDENNNLRHFATLNAWKDLTKHTIFSIDNSFLSTEDPLSREDIIRDDEVIIPGDYSIRTSRNEYYSNTTIARLRHEFGKEKQITAGFIYSFLENDDPEVEDNERYQPEIDLIYWFNVKYGLTAGAAYTKGIFDRDPEFEGDTTGDFENWSGSLNLTRRFSRHFSAFIQYTHTYRDYEGDTDNDYMVYAPSVGINWQLQEDTSLTVGLGYFVQDVDESEEDQEDDEAEDEDGLFLNAAINKRWNYRRGNINLNAAAGLRQNNFGAQNLGLEQFVSVRSEADYLFSKNLSGFITGGVQYSDVKGGDAENDIEEQIRYALGTGLSYFPYRWMSINLTYRHIRYDSKSDNEIEDEKISENRVLFGIALQSEFPWKF